MTQAYIGLGSNLGDRLANLATGCRALAEMPGTALLAVSRAYESEPWGVEDQPPFANAVARIDTSLRADQLLGFMQDAERRCGREPSERFGPRCIDLDILLFGDEEWTTEHLTIPHARMGEREFVLRPLRDLWPDARWPDGRPISGEGWVGRVVTDLGVIPGMEEYAPATPPGAGRAEPSSGGETAAFPPAGPPASEGPIGAGAWVPVAELHAIGRIDGVPDFGIHFKALVLEQEGIRYMWDPAPPEQSFNPWGLSQTVRLMVSEADADRARQVLEEASAAPPELEEG